MLYASTAFESAALLPCLASSIVAYSTFALFITPQPIFSFPPINFSGLRELPLYAILTLLCAGVGWLYVRVFYGLRDRFFKPMPIPRQLKPAVGGLLLGLLALAFPQVMTGGYGWVQWGAIGMPPELTMPPEAPFVPHMGMRLLLILAILKIVATGLTISSGGSGGVFGPSILIGGMLGGACGQFLAYLMPAAHIEPSAFVLVGMGGFFAGVSKTPLTSIVMVSEMTGSYSLLVPLMLACGLNMARLAAAGRSTRSRSPRRSTARRTRGTSSSTCWSSSTSGRSDTGRRGSNGSRPRPRSASSSTWWRASTETLFPVVDRAGAAHGDLHAPRPADRPGGLRLGAAWSWPTTWRIARCSRSPPRTTCTPPCGG